MAAESRLPALVTADWLSEHGACAEQVAVIRELFPNGAKVTMASLRKARAAGLDVKWLSHRLPNQLRAEYDRQVAALWAEYDRQVAALWAEYKRQVAPLWAEYDRQVAPLRAEYDRQVAPLRAEYDRQVDTALVKAWKEATK